MRESKNEPAESKEPDQMSDYELLQYVAAIEQDNMLHAPVYMKDEILRKSQSPVVQLTVTTQKMSKKMQLFRYSLRVSAAVVGALAFLVVLSMPSDFVTSHIPKKEGTKTEWNIANTLYSGSNQVTSFLDDITSSIFSKKNVPEGR